MSENVNEFIRREAHREQSTEVLRTLTNQLGFSETEPMRTLRKKIAESGKDAVPDMLRDWNTEGQLTVDASATEKDELTIAKLQLGLYLTQALIQLESGFIQEFRDSVYECYVYASSLGLAEEAEALYGIYELW